MTSVSRSGIAHGTLARPVGEFEANWHLSRALENISVSCVTADSTSSLFTAHALVASRYRPKTAHSDHSGCRGELKRRLEAERSVYNRNTLCPTSLGTDFALSTIAVLPARSSGAKRGRVDATPPGEGIRPYPLWISDTHATCATCRFFRRPEMKTSFVLPLLLLGAAGHGRNSAGAIARYVFRNRSHDDAPLRTYGHAPNQRQGVDCWRLAGLQRACHG